MVDIALKKYDKHDMYSNINNFYRQLIDGIAIGSQANIAAIKSISINNIVLAGMGGSAIGGDIIKSLLKYELNIPFETYRNYGLPGSAKEGSLIICSSYSGNTEETLSAFKAAVENKCNILCITTGGQLQKEAQVYQVPVVKIPAGLMPREALGYSVAPLLVVLGRLGLCRDYSAEINSCAELLKQKNEDYAFESKNNLAYTIAHKLAGRIAIIYAGPNYFDAVAVRIKGQINENAKQHAFCNIFPEFNHNELVGWELGAQISNKYTVGIFHSKDDHPQVAKRMAIIKEIIERKGIEVIELWASGTTVIERMFSLIQLGDYISYYMALINGVDPTPVELIDYMKNLLKDK